MTKVELSDIHRPGSDGQDFGGNYFGTGDSVLKHWRGE